MNKPEKLSDRRRQRRRYLNVPVLMSVGLGMPGKKKINAFSRDISRLGMFIETDLPVRKETVVEISFSIPGSGKKTSLSGRVVRLVERKRKNMSRASGFAISFEDIDRDVLEEIERYISAASFFLDE